MFLITCDISYRQGALSSIALMELENNVLRMRARLGADLNGFRFVNAKSSTAPHGATLVVAVEIQDVSVSEDMACDILTGNFTDMVKDGLLQNRVCEDDIGSYRVDVKESLRAA